MDKRKKCSGENSSSAQEPEKRRCAFMISPEVDFKLSAYARKHQVDRSDIVQELLSEKLRCVVISFREKSSEGGEAAQAVTAAPSEDMPVSKNVPADPLLRTKAGEGSRKSA